MRQTLHLQSPGNWINDPNGFIYYRGEYHLFYQYFPYAPRWGTMHWGHAVSRDLTDWRHLPVALFPTIREDQNGCFSGSAIEKDGALQLFYTGVHYREVCPDNIHECVPGQMEAVQLTLTSPDGRTFDNFGGKRILIDRIVQPEWGDIGDTRDPKVWQADNGWYLLLGSTYHRREGMLLLYHSADLERFTLVDRVHSDRFGWLLECPDYFVTEEGKGVLVVSPIGMRTLQGERPQPICMAASCDEEKGKLTLPEQYQLVDYGGDLYAPQTTLDECGRRTLVGWMRMPKPAQEGWIGMFCYPRLVQSKKGRIYFPLHPMVKRHFTRPIAFPAQANGSEYVLSAVLREGKELCIGGYRIWRQQGCLYTDRTGLFEAASGELVCHTDPLLDGDTISVYVSRYLVEVFANDGEAVISNVVYGMGEELDVSCISEYAIYAR